MKQVDATPAKNPSSRDRVRRYRDAMRARGYRQVTIWVPDIRRPEIAEEYRRQILRLKESEAEQRYVNELDLPDVAGWT